jgi:hypothetical protein
VAAAAGAADTMLSNAAGVCVCVCVCECVCECMRVSVCACVYLRVRVFERLRMFRRRSVAGNEV